MVSDKTLSIQMNGVTMHSLVENGGWTDLLENAPAMELSPESGSLATQHTLFTELFPSLQIFKMPSLIDRAGHLDKHKVMTNIHAIDKNLKKNEQRVIRCGNGIEVGGRPNGWIHINANGDMFICCNDYDFDTIFGNVNDRPISEIWMSLAHQKMILHSYKTLCTTCASAIWG
jgi:MoaA/NifB/PqqE/SkfB family radical SAM enzyme